MLTQTRVLPKYSFLQSLIPLCNLSSRFQNPQVVFTAHAVMSFFVVSQKSETQDHVCGEWIKICLHLL